MLRFSPYTFGILALTTSLAACTATINPEPETVDGIAPIHDLEQRAGGSESEERDVDSMFYEDAPSVRASKSKPAHGAVRRPTPYPHPTMTVAEPEPTPIPDDIGQPTETYTDYGINSFVTTDDDPLSTFAIDVDTASYTMVRRQLREGGLPAHAAVRVEEFVNYFQYDYRQPSASTPFAVDFEAAPSPWNPETHLVRVGVQGKNVTYDERKPVHLTFLMDTSCSMQSEDKLGLAKQTLDVLTRELEDGDTVAIATYAGSSEIVLPPTPMSDRATILRSLDRLDAAGSTAMASGIDLAYRLADRTYVPGGVNRVIVLSDGDANVGTTSHTEIASQIRSYAEKGITLTTVGFGRGNYRDTMMEQLANKGDGNYYYIDSMTEARRVFVDKLTSTLEVIAKDVKIQVDFDPSRVESYRLIGYENRDVADKDFRNDKVDAGEIGAGHQVTALYEVKLNPGSGDLATVRVRSKLPGPDAPAVERAYPLRDSAVASTFASASTQTRIATAAAGLAEILRGSRYVEGLTFADLEAIAVDAARSEYAEDEELAELIRTAASLRGEALVSSR